MNAIDLRRCGAALALAGAFTAAQASCGSAACTLMTDRYVQGGEPHPGWSVDLRLEAVNQKTLRRGSSTISADQVSGEEAIERHTRNLNLVTTLEYGLDADWSLALRIPLVHRDHAHDLLDEETGLPATPEQWRFTRLGDAQALLRRRFGEAGAPTSWALFGGLKLPTGSIRIRNADGARAERALQPGTGTTDLVLGVAARRSLGLADALFGQAGVTQALGSREEFKPGRTIELSAGWSHAWSHELSSVLQLNLRQRGRDAGAQAEPEQSGSTTLNLSPGLSYALSHVSTVYAYLQLPLAQRVNGIQLVPRSALALGWTSDF